MRLGALSHTHTRHTHAHDTTHAHTHPNTALLPMVIVKDDFPPPAIDPDFATEPYVESTVLYHAAVLVTGFFKVVVLPSGAGAASCRNAKVMSLAATNGRAARATPTQRILSRHHASNEQKGQEGQGIRTGGCARNLKQHNTTQTHIQPRSVATKAQGTECATAAPGQRGPASSPEPRRTCR